MNKLIIMIAIFFAACSGEIRQEDAEKEKTGKHEDAHSAVALDNGKKWKSDSTTKVHVAALHNLVNDERHNSQGKAGELAAQLKSEVDALVKDCTMKGPKHDALHVWLERLLGDIKELKEGEADEYNEARESLQKHVADFYVAFE